MLTNRRATRRSRSPQPSNDSPLELRAARPKPVAVGHAFLVGPSIATNRWIASVADGAGYAVSSERRFDSLWTSAASSADVVVVEAQRDHQNALMAAIEGSTVSTRRRMVLLTWRLHWETIERALQLEIADFQPMPCRTEELVARMRAASVRAACRDWLFDFSEPSALPSARSRPFEREGACALRLTMRERALYRVLAAREGEVVSRAELLAAVWSKDSHDSAASNIVDVYVRYLRVKLAAAMPDVGIETVKRVGYVLRRKGASIPS